MIDLQTAADGVGRLRVRHVGGSEGILTGILFNSADGPQWRRGDGTTLPLRPCPILSVALNDGGRLEAPQASIEVVE